MSGDARITFKCSKCGAGLQATSQHSGQTFRCPRCGGVDNSCRCCRAGSPHETATGSTDSTNTSPESAPPKGAPEGVRRPECRRPIAWEPDLAGQVRPCPYCGQWFEMPNAVAMSESGATPLFPETVFSPPSDEASWLGPAPTAKYCHHCGQLIASLAEICPKCGVRQQGVPTGVVTSSPKSSPNRVAAALFASTPGSIRCPQVLPSSNGDGRLLPSREYIPVLDLRGSGGIRSHLPD